MTLITKRFSLLIWLLLFSSSSFSQAIGDYGAMSSGNWGASIWGTWNGATWTAVGTTPVSTNNVWIPTGRTVVLSGGSAPYSCKNLVVEAGAKLWANNGTNVYCYVYGTTLLCDGQIGNGATFDGISFGFEGTTCTISGAGMFDASRMRKNTSLNTTTNLIIAMSLNLRWNAASGTQLYNAANGTNFNVTINAFCTVNLIPNGPNIGNVCIDGLDGTQIGTEAGGTFIVNGTLIISGILYLTTNNTSATYACNWIVNGLVQANEIVASSSGTGGHAFTLNAGAKLDITGTPAWSSLGTVNNSFDFGVGSTVEYSAAGTQTVRVASEFGAAVAHRYYNLILSNTGNKSTSIDFLWVRNDLTITGSSVLDPNPVTSTIYVGGNWINYNSSGFSEKTTTVYMNGAALQTISCPGGEVYNILRYQKGLGSHLQFNNPVDVISQLVFASNGYVDLNSNALTIRNSATTGIQGANANRYIVSEKTDNSSKIVWRINNGIGTYTYPFGVTPGGAANYVPVVAVKNAANNIGDLTFSTYSTPPDNTPWPTTPTAVSNLWAYFAIYNNPDNRHYTVDRFWEVTSTAPTLLFSVTFNYRTSELPDLDLDPGHLGAQFWAGAYSVWNLTQWGIPVASGVTVTSFSYFNTAWTLTSLTSPLPVELLNFDATPEEKQVDLSWTTASEINNNYFTVEKSIDGYDFYEIGQIEGAGNSTIRRTYQLTDKNPVYGISYYRLKQTDYDGTFTYSDAIPVKYKKHSGHYSVFPNPAGDIAYITGDASTKSQLIIRTTEGREIQQLTLDGTQQITSLNISDLSSGMYIVEIKSEFETQFLRLVKR